MRNTLIPLQSSCYISKCFISRGNGLHFACMRNFRIEKIIFGGGIFLIGNSRFRIHITTVWFLHTCQIMDLAMFYLAEAFYGFAGEIYNSKYIVKSGRQTNCYNSAGAISFLLIFGRFLRQNIRPKYAPPRRTNYTLKWRGGEAAPPIYFIFTPSRRGIFWSNILL